MVMGDGDTVQQKRFVDTLQEILGSMRTCYHHKFSYICRSSCIYDDCMTKNHPSKIMRGKSCLITTTCFFIVIFNDDPIKELSLNILRPS